MLALSGCSADPPGPTPIIRGLHTIPTTGACAGVGLEATIQGSPDDPAVAWIQSIGPDVHRLEAVWPSGFHAVFDPTMTIVDGAGRPQMRAGDYLDGACVTAGGPDNTILLLIPPFPALRLECGQLQTFECSAVLSTAMHGGGAWPSDPIAVVKVLTRTGDYEIVFEDGRRLTGHANVSG